MTLTLAANTVVAGSAGTGSAITCSIFGDEVGATGTDSFKLLYQGVLGTSPTTLYTVGGTVSQIVKTVTLVNVTGAPVTVLMFVGGIASANKVAGLTIPANGSATYLSDGWSVYDASGVRQYVGSTGPTGARGLTWQGAWSGAATYAIDDAVYYATTGGSYRSLQAGNLNHTPPAVNDAFWYLIAAKGDQGVQGNTGNAGVIQTVTAGNGLTGGGSAATVTLDVANADGSISVTADDVKVGVLQTDAQHGTRGGGGIHANVVAAGAAGFMTGADKTKLDAITGSHVGNQSGTNTGDLTLAAVGASPNANAASLAGQALTLQPASQSFAGLLLAVDKKIIDDLHYDAVADFGWVGNDSTDNLAAWNTMIAALPTGATVFFPSGTYRVSGELTINVDKRIAFRGVGRYNSVIKTTSATANIFNVSIPAWYNTFNDLGFQSSVTKTAGAAIAISSGSAVGTNVYRCWMTGLFKGIDAQGAQSGNLSVWSDLDISGIPNGGRGLHINGSTINVMIHNATINGGAATTSACCEINQSGAVQVTACDWIQGTNVVLMNSNAGAGPQAVYFTNVFFDQPQGSVIKIIGTNTANRIKFTQCGIAPTGNNHAVEINGTGAGAVGTATALPAGISLVDCDIYSSNGTNTGAGVLVNGCQDINIQSCRITGFNGAAGAAVSVIPSASNLTKVRVNGCILGPNSNLTVTNETGVKLVAGSSGLAQLSITDNSMYGSGTGITDASTMLAGVSKNINNNSGAASGLQAQLTSAAGITLTATEQVILQIPLAANSLKVGTTFRFSMTGTATATTVTVRVRIGTAGTIADPGLVQMVSGTLAVGGMVIDGQTQVTVVGASGAHAGAVGVRAATVASTLTPTLSGNFATTSALFISVCALAGVSGPIIRTGSLDIFSPA